MNARTKAKFDNPLRGRKCNHSGCEYDPIVLRNFDVDGNPSEDRPYCGYHDPIRRRDKAIARQRSVSDSTKRYMEQRRQKALEVVRAWPLGRRVAMLALLNELADKGAKDEASEAVQILTSAEVLDMLEEADRKAKKARAKREQDQDAIALIKFDRLKHEATDRDTDAGGGIRVDRKRGVRPGDAR